MKDISLRQLLLRAKRKVAVLESMINQTDPPLEYNWKNRKRKHFRQVISDIQEEFEGLPLVVEHKAWWYNNTAPFLEKRVIPANYRFPYKMGTNSLIVGSWVKIGDKKVMVTGVSFMFRGNIRHSQVEVVYTMNTGRRTLAAYSTVPMRQLSPLSFKERMKLPGVKRRLVKFFRMFLEHCRYMPGSKISGYYDTTRNHFYQLSGQSNH